jgi:2,4-dienoyl-CoA reductase-like NADH-dependent reductase (Old Yellow Enzyme family)
MQMRLDLDGFSSQNPDLPERLAHKRPLNEPESETYYTAGEKGYIDYPKWT